MPDAKANINFDTNAAATKGDILQLVKSLETTRAGAKATEQSFQSMGDKVLSLSKGFKGLAAEVAGLSIFKAIATDTAKYNNTLFDVGQTAKFTSQGFKDMEKAALAVSNATKLNMQESAQLVGMFQKQMLGTRATADEITKYAKAIQINSVDQADMIKQTKELLEVQNKMPNAFDKTNESLDDKAIYLQVQQLIKLRGVSQEAAITYGNFLKTARDGESALTPEQKSLKELSESMSKLKAAGENLAVAFGKVLAPYISMAADGITKFANWLKNADPLLIKVTAGVLGLAAAWKTMSVAKNLLGIGGIGGGGGGMGGGGGILGKVGGALGLGGKPDGTAGKPFHVVMGAGGGASELEEKGEKALGGKAAGWLAKARSMVNLEGMAPGLMKNLLTKYIPIASVIASGVGGLRTATSTKAHEENLLGRGGQGFGDSIVTGLKSVINPYQGGKDIVSAIRLGFENAKNLFVSEGQGPGAAASAANKAASADFAKMSPEQYKKFFTDKEAERTQQAAALNGTAGGGGGVTGPKNDLAGFKAAMEAASGDAIKANEAYEKGAGFIQTQLDNTDKLIDSQKQQLDFAEMYSLNVKESISLNASLIEKQKAQVALNKERLALADRLLASAPDDITFQNQRSEAAKSLVKSQMELNEQVRKGPKLYEQTLSVQESQLGVLESQMNLNKSLYAGLGPQLEIMGQMYDKLDAIKSTLTSQLKLTEEKLKDDAENPQLLKDQADLQRKITEAAQKQVDLAKNLKEGYLDALAAFTNVSGAFGKIITTKEQNLGELLRRTGQTGSLRGGGIGGGFTQAYAKFSPGGDLSMNSPEQREKLLRARGLDKMGKPAIGAMAGLGGLNETQQGVVTTAGGQSGVISGRARGGAGFSPGVSGVQAGNVTAAAAGGGDPLTMLNENMSKYVAEGVNMSKLVEGKMSGGTTKPTEGEKKIASAVEKQTTEQKKKETDVQTAARGTNPGSAGGNRGGGGGDSLSQARSQNQASMDSITRFNAENRVGGRNLTNVPIGNLSNAVKAGGGGGGAGGGGGRGAELAHRDPMAPQRDELKRLVGSYDKSAGMLSLLKRTAAEEGQGATANTGYGNTKLNIDALEDAQSKRGKRIDELRGEIGASGAGKPATVTLDPETKKNIKDTAQSNKNMEKLTQDAAGKFNAGGGALGLDMGNQPSMSTNAGVGSFGSFGGMSLNMGNKPTDFGLGSAIGANSNSLGFAGFQALGMAGGGSVPGSGSGDTVPAMLTPGERIINKRVSKKFGPFLDALNKNKYAMGGIVGTAPSAATMGGGGGGGGIAINVKGDSVDRIMKSVTTQLHTQLNRMIAPHGTTGRQFEISQ